MNYFKRLETILIAVIILVLGIAYGLLNDDTKPSNNNASTTLAQTQEQTQEEPAETALIRYPGQDGKTAMELLKSKYRVETQSFGDMGEFVKSIEGTQSDSSHFWSFYVNGQQSQVGADAYVTKPADNIEWKLEEIK